MSGNQFFNKKAYEIAYAVFRVSPRILDASIAGKLTAGAAELLAGTAAGDYQQSRKSLDILDQLIKFSTELNFISFTNGDILVREIANLDASFAASLAMPTEDIDISTIFSDSFGHSFSIIPEKQAANQEASAEKKAEEKKASNEGSSGNSGGSIVKSGMRQIAILDRIRQSGNCRLRDIQEVLPDCSERTIRYDLEDLMERNIIERLGNGGPSVSYRIRQMA